MASTEGLKRSNRHFVHVTVDDVMTAINGICRPEWTTDDVAGALGVGERSVRATIRRLKARSAIREAGKVRRTTSRKGRVYYSTAYETVEHGGECDYPAMASVLCRGG